MNGEAMKSQASAALGLIERAFADRSPPSAVSGSLQLSESEYAEVMSFQGRRWQDVTSEQVRQRSDAVFWFSPTAFCYYLAGLLAPGLRELRWDCNAYDSLIGSLDRSPGPDGWDDCFLPRWPLLTADEIEAVASWVRWLETDQPSGFFDNTCQRVQYTLTLFKWKAEQRQAPAKIR